jgi:V8-like Glu-specific endopeptidase
MRGVAKLFLMVVAASVIAGCEKTRTEELSTDESEIVGGVVDYNWMAVGRVWWQTKPGEWSLCTGTLIDRQIVITAAHCVGYATEIPVSDTTKFEFEITPTREASFTYKVVSVISRPTEYQPNRDIALLKLSGVPPADISRYSLGTALPAAGTSMTAWGYGCTDQVNDNTGYGVKRRRNFKWGVSTDLLCPGDSGGPLVTRDGGEIVGINSAYCVNGACDGWANVPRFLEWIKTSMTQL